MPSLFPDGCVAVPSLHRANCLRTIKFFPEALYVVEPHDEENYRAAGVHNLVVLPSDGQGISYVRNFILDNAERRVIVVDDDMTSIAKRVGIEKGFYKFSRDDDIGNVAIDHLLASLDLGFAVVGPIRQGGACVPPPKRIVSFVAVDAIKIGDVRYRRCADLFEDFDFQLQAMKRGVGVAVTSQIAYGAPNLGTNAGGHNGSFRTKKNSLHALNFMLKEWPGIVDVVVKPRGPEPRISWAKAGKIVVL